MARPLKEIEQELMNLSREDRVRLARTLIVSLDEEEEQLSEAECEALWLEEVKRRDAEIERGEVQPVPVDEALRRAKRTAGKKIKARPEGRAFICGTPGNSYLPMSRI